MQRPKNLGSMGFRYVDIFNKATIMKLSWRFANDYSGLWAKLLMAKYYGAYSFWCVQGPDVARVSSNKAHVLTYEDKERDWMMVEVVPWEMFLTSVKRLNITRADKC
ncbi:hypothetical protein Taro_012421 [Colocasia esculenta]|uniref:Auxin-responsive protein n=1 Tax=Colocasia esculenta TaxID=4460 RepID=A0A843UCS2_COLES|nr:hypothetical protein [Colocasia esculenta]